MTPALPPSGATVNALAAAKLRFPSKRDSWITALIWLGAALCVLGGFAQLGSEAGAAVRGVLLVALLLSAGFMVWVLHGTAYVFTPDLLDIRCGPFHFQVPLTEIESVVPSRNPLSSPACSLDRLLIRYAEGRRKILISPLDKRGFLEALASRCPHLVLSPDQARLFPAAEKK
jgi:hypothetical protein